jgi:exopolyphosphatase/guanosine-5'-triphosphate,3'-diphosphate pyrophosphatase
MGDAPDMPYRQARPARSAPVHGNAHPKAPGKAAGTARPREPRHFAALDLGTNNCRLLIARPQGDGFAVVDAFSRIVRLGEGLASSGRLSDAAIERTIAALKICADFIARAYAETGILLDIISAEEEARLAVLGCHALIEPGEGPALVFDIGGGSTELVLVDTRPALPVVLDWHSAPWGVVSLTESAGHGPPGRDGGADGRAASYARMRDLVAESMAGFAARLPRDVTVPRLLGTSGTVTTLASVHLGLTHYDRAQVDGLIVPATALRRISADLAAMDLRQRATLPCIGTERADLVVAGCAILETIMDLWPAERIGIADRGIREGILRRLMGNGS